MENHKESVKYDCKICEKTFTVKSNLKRHVLKEHDSKTVPQKCICYHCSTAFTNKYNLIRHLAKCNNNGNERQRCSREVKCILCNNYTGLKINLLSHYASDHDINISTQNLQFDSFSQFEVWKDQIERDTVSMYARHDSRKASDKTIYYYRCHRDGFYQSKGKHIRHLKLKGTNKIDGYCPAKIDVTVMNATGRVHVLFLTTHVGHTMDLEKIPLKKSDRQLLASKISQKVPFDEIINNVKGNFDRNNYSRIRLLTRKDLFNIEQLYNLNKESVRHANDYKTTRVKISDLRKRHKEADSMTDSAVVAEVEAGKVWTVDSSTGLDFYSIEILNKSCDCNLRCNECNACVHAYVCSCPDSAIRGNMCKHVHLLCTHLQKFNPPATYEIIGDEQCENQWSEEETVFEQLSLLACATSTSNINQYKKKVSQMFQSILSFANTIEHYRVIEKALAPILPTLTAMASESSEVRNYVPTDDGDTPLSSSREIRKRKIEPQNRFIPTKKPEGIATTKK